MFIPGTELLTLSAIVILHEPRSTIVTQWYMFRIIYASWFYFDII